MSGLFRFVLSGIELARIEHQLYPTNHKSIARLGLFYMKLLFVTLLIPGVLSLSSCKKSADVDPVEATESADTLHQSESSASGFGSSIARPEGIPFVFPAGIQVVGKPKLELDCSEEATRNRKVVGGGDAVIFCLTFRNTTGLAIRVEFPPRTIWISESSRVQNGITLKWVRLTVPAQSTVTYLMNAYCINPPRLSTRVGDSYESQPMSSNHPGMRELEQLVINKQITGEEYGGDVKTAIESAFAIQGAVYEVAKTGKISDRYRELIASLPDVK